MLNNKKYQKGFGLLEVLLSAVIIIMILGALVFIGRQAMANSAYTQERAQAIYLAQEGIELTRQIRDTNWIDGSPATQWNTLDPPNTAVSDKSYYIKNDGTKYFLAVCSNQARCLEGDITVAGVQYNRRLDIKNLDRTNLIPNATTINTYAIKINAIISWPAAAPTHTITSSEILTNWRPNN